MCHSLRCKLIDMSTEDHMKSISRTMLAAHAHVTESNLVERLSVIMIIECEESFTPPDVTQDKI